MREDREHPDVRIARRAENLARVAAVAHERGDVSPGLRRVIVIQAVRLVDLSVARLAYAEGRSRPYPDSMNVQALVGDVLGGIFKKEAEIHQGASLGLHLGLLGQETEEDVDLVDPQH